MTVASVAEAKPKKNPIITFDLSLGLQEAYDDNVYQTQFFEESDLVTLVTPGVAAQLRAIKWLNLGGSYRSEIYYYLDHSDLNDIFHQVDFDIGLELSKYKKWKNFRLGLEIDYDPVAISAVNSLDVTYNTTQKGSVAIVPGYTIPVSPTFDIDLEARAVRVIYIGPGADSYGADLAVKLRKRIARRIYLWTRGTAAYQNYDDAGEIYIYGAHAGFDVEFFKRLNGGAGFGYQIVDLETGTEGAFSMEANLQYLLSKRTTLSLKANRSNTVDILGNDFISTAVSLSGEHRLSMKSLLGLEAYYRHAEQNSVISGLLLDDTITSLGLRLGMRYTNHWTFSIFGEQNENGGQNQTTDFTQHRFGVEVRYQYPLAF